MNFFVYLLSIFIAINLLKNVDALDNGVSFRHTSQCEERGTPGLICSDDCQYLQRCVKIGTGWKTFLVERCNGTELCNINVAGCSNMTGPCVPTGYEGNFVCTSEGLFPNPYDCQKYHMCYNASGNMIAQHIECGLNRAFNVAKGDCSLNIFDSVCETQQYDCKNSGDAHPWPGNANIFYICGPSTIQTVPSRSLYPTLYRCFPGEIFNNGICTTDLSQPNETTTQQSIKPTTSDPNKPNENLPCSNAGIFKNPNDCKSYFVCRSKGDPWKLYNCPSNTYFDETLLFCKINDGTEC